MPFILTLTWLHFRNFGACKAVWMVNNVFDDGAFSEVFKNFIALVLRRHKCMFLGWCDERVPVGS